MLSFLTLAALASAFSQTAPEAPMTRINIDATRVISHPSRHMTGACIEDVNHEVYGGIYTQMLFGESFQEGLYAPPPAGFTAYGGAWVARDGVLDASAGEGPKLLVDGRELADGAVSVDIRFADASAGNAGLILRAANPRTGADTWTGYEVSLEPGRQVVVVGRHQDNWTPLAEAPATIATGEWATLSVTLAGGRLDVSVGGEHALTVEDAAPLGAGAVGLRTWQRAAQFRGLRTAEAGADAESVPLVAAGDDRLSGEVSRMWRPVHRGTAKGEFALRTDVAFVGAQSQEVTFREGEGAVGIENGGLNRWGLRFREGKPYEGRLWVKAEKPAAMLVSFESADGSRVYAETALAAQPGDWQPLDFTLTPDANDEHGRMAIWLTEPGAVLLGYARLEPGEWGRFKGLPIRRDVVEALIAHGITVLRYGGCMAEADEYRWKKMIGPRDRREPYRGFWYPESTNGWGIFDFLNFCEAAGFLAIPDFHIDETPEDMADFIEYAKGQADSEWGAKRVADGHPEPYDLPLIQLGNEETVDEVYWEKFRPLAEAIWARDPDVTLVVGDFAYNQVIEDPYSFTGAPTITSLAAHKKILELARDNDREVWFDIHVWSEFPERMNDQIGAASFIEQLKALCPEARFKVACFELNANSHDLRRGLANARAISRLERIGDDVPVVCSANCLQPDGQNDNGWNQGLLFLNPSSVWPQAALHVAHMISSTYLPECIEATVTQPAEALEVTAKRSDDGSILQLQVVNISPEPVGATIGLSGFAPTTDEVEVLELTGELTDANTAEHPDALTPTKRTVALEVADGAFHYTFPANSFTIVRIH